MTIPSLALPRRWIASSGRLGGYRRRRSPFGCCEAFLSDGGNNPDGARSTSNATLSFSSGPSSSASNRAKVAVVGSGRMGHIRTKLIHANPKFELVGIVDSNLSAAQALGRTYHVPALERLDQVETTLDGVVCCSPTFSHRPIVEQVIKSGIRHVFLEKPVEESAAKIETLYNLTSQHNVALCCGFQRRFDPSYQSALAQMPTILSGPGDAGPSDVIYANIFFGDHPVPPMEFLLQGGGDIFMDLSAHDVDYVLQALRGQSVVSVYATGTSSTLALQQAGVHDNATMLLTCSGGTVVNIFLSRSASYGYDQRAEFFGRGGRIQVGNIPETSTVVSTLQGICHSKYQHSFPQRFHDAFGNEMDRFADILLGIGPAWPVTKEDCIRVQRIADAAQESARLGQVVQLQ